MVKKSKSTKLKKPKKKRQKKTLTKKSVKLTSVVAGVATDSHVVGIDQNYVASKAALDIANGLLTKNLEFWGRYFKGPGNTSTVQYQQHLEAKFFHDNSIRVLPIGRQTNRVGGSKAEGYADGQRNGAALIASFGANHLAGMLGLCVFLDVEPQVPLSSNYFDGWSSGLIEAGQKTMIDFGDDIGKFGITAESVIRFLPCVYGHHSDDSTWRALSTSVGRGSECHGAWMVFMDLNAGFPIWPWRVNFTNRYLPSSVPVLLTQRILDYKVGRHDFDFDLANPAHSQWLLERLVLPLAEIPSFTPAKKNVRVRSPS